MDPTGPAGSATSPSFFEDFVNGQAVFYPRFTGSTSLPSPGISILLDFGSLGSTLAGSEVFIVGAIDNVSLGVLFANAISNSDGDGLAQLNITADRTVIATNNGDLGADFTMIQRVLAANGQLAAGQSILTGMPASAGVIDIQFDRTAGLWFEVNPNVNGNANWGAGGVDTGIDSGDGLWYAFKIVLEVPGTSASFFVDDVLITQVTGLAPTQYGVGGNVVTPAGDENTSYSYAVDYVKMDYPIPR